MAKNKEKVFHITGTTVVLADGLARPFTVVGVVTEKTKMKTKRSHEFKDLPNGTGYQEIKTVVDHEVYTQTLRVGIAALSPKDTALASAESGINIALGKAKKEKSNHLTLTSSVPYFTKGVVEAILQRQADIFGKTADKHIIVSPPKKAESAEDFSPRV